MNMKCRACSREMNQAEFLTHLGIWFVKQLGPLAAEGLMRIVMSYFGLTRGILDSVMVATAHDLGFQCPQCKKDTCWDPAPESELKNISQIQLLYRDDEDVVRF